MSKNISEEEYLILLQYFDGTIDSLNKEIIDNLKKNQFDGNDIPVIDPEILKKFLKILRIKKKNPEKYASYQWNYPNWDQKTIDSKLKEISILSKKMYISKDEYLIKSIGRLSSLRMKKQLQKYYERKGGSRMRTKYRRKKSRKHSKKQTKKYIS